MAYDSEKEAYKVDEGVAAEQRAEQDENLAHTHDGEFGTKRDLVSGRGGGSGISGGRQQRALTDTRHPAWCP